MFSLIITIIAIALVVATIAATMYYGGDALNQGSAKADAAAVVSGAQQIAGAYTLYTTVEGSKPADFQALVTGTTNGSYLTALPVVKATGPWVLTVTGVDLPGVNANACQKLADAASNQYTCDTATQTFTYKL